MRAVTKPGPQPPSCCVESCDNPPAPGDVMCRGHVKLAQQRGGSLSNMAEPPIMEPDDPAVLEAAAKKAAVQEAAEYAERRRVKTWKTNENGTRTPEEYWTEEELAKMDDEVAVKMEQIRVLNQRVRDDPAIPEERHQNLLDPAAMEPHWDGSQWVLRPKSPDVDLDAVRDLVRQLVLELGL